MKYDYSTPCHKNVITNILPHLLTLIGVRDRWQATFLTPSISVSWIFGHQNANMDTKMSSQTFGCQNVTMDTRKVTPILWPTNYMSNQHYGLKIKPGMSDMYNHLHLCKLAQKLKLLLDKIICSNKHN